MAMSSPTQSARCHSPRAKVDSVGERGGRLALQHLGHPAQLGGHARRHHKARPRPPVTAVPRKARLRRSATTDGSTSGSSSVALWRARTRRSGRPRSRAAQPLDQAQVSGEHVAWASRTTSPGTSSAAGTSRTWPSRTTWTLGGHGLERRHRLLGPVLLNKADDSVQDDDSQDHDRVLQVADDRRDRRGRDQDQDDGVGELLGQ
jgi:hypothetical protein